MSVLVTSSWLGVNGLRESHSTLTGNEKKSSGGATPPLAPGYMSTIFEEAVKELRAVGCSEDLYAPHGTMGFMPEKLETAAGLAGLLEEMVHRRENLWRTDEAVGIEASTHSREDVDVVIRALKATIAKLSLPA